MLTMLDYSPGENTLLRPGAQTKMAGHLSTYPMDIGFAPMYHLSTHPMFNAKTVDVQGSQMQDECWLFIIETLEMEKTNSEPRTKSWTYT